MKVRLRKFSSIIGLLCFLAVLGGCANSSDKASLARAMKSVKNSSEFHTLSVLLGQKKEECLELVHEKACDSDWVSCVEDAWVIHLKVKPSCVGYYEERLRVMMLVDFDGKIISRYPGEDYLRDPLFCWNTDECLGPPSAPEACRNFIHAPFVWAAQALEPGCQCLKNRCVPAAL